MKRRLLATLPVAACVLAATRRLHAQPQRSVRIGFLTPNRRHSLVPSIERALAEIGYTPAGGLIIELRESQGNAASLDALAAELVQLPVDLIIAAQSPSALAAHRASKTLPIVVAGIAIDPVAAGLVQSLARPGGNVTGVAGLGANLAGKAMQYMRDLRSSSQRIGALVNADDAFTPSLRDMLQQAALALGIELQVSSVREPAEYAPAFAAWSAANVDAVFIQPSLAMAPAIKLATAQRLPSFSFSRPFVAEGGLLSYSASVREVGRRVAFMVDRILKGDKPAHIPMEQPANFDLLINLRTARALGLKVPASLLALADEVIE